MPFFIIICLGIICVLVYNLWTAFYNPAPDKAAYFYVIEGNVEMKAWGTDSFINLPSGSLFIEGDELKTSSSSKVIVEFFDGTIMRVGPSTDIVLEEVDSDSELPKIKVLLLSGELWFNKVYRDSANTDLIVSIENISVKSSSGNVFDVENLDFEAARVLNGADLVIDVYSENDDKVVASENVGLGQEIVFSTSVLERYWSFQSPTVLAALSDEFRSSDWYLWNISEDSSPSVFGEEKASNVFVSESLVPVEPEIIRSSTIDDSEIVKDELSVDSTDLIEEVSLADKEIVTGDFKSPTISSVANVTVTNDAGFYEVTSRVATLTGTVSGASKVVVNEYTLEKFMAGDANWTYYANADFDLMKEGENIYEVYALDADGNKSDVLTVKVLYTPPVVVVDPVVETVVEPVSDVQPNSVESSN